MGSAPDAAASAQAQRRRRGSSALRAGDQEQVGAGLGAPQGHAGIRSDGVRPRRESSESVMVTPEKPSAAAQEPVDDRRRPGGGAPVERRVDGRRQHHRSGRGCGETRPCRAGGPSSRSAAGAVIRTSASSVETVASPSPGKCLSVGHTPPCSRGRPRTRRRRMATVNRSVENARCCCSMKSAGPCGHIGDRRQIDVDAVGVEGGRRARPGAGRRRWPAVRRAACADRPGGAQGIRLTLPPSWSVAMISGGWPPACAAACSDSSSAVSLGGRRGRSTPNRMTPPTWPGLHPREQVRVGAGSRERHDQALADELRKRRRRGPRPARRSRRPSSSPARTTAPSLDAIMAPP